jgi:small subunit ribosomal protein S21|tara:strand:- start:3400 stop:3597 length:198 start_codon:yes stop_codon:yes gene_type:complete
MLIIKVNKDKGGIESAIKRLRKKVRRTKQINKLREGKQFTKPSVKKRLQKQKAIYIQKIRTEEEK